MYITLPKKLDERIVEDLGAFKDKKGRLYVRRDDFEKTMAAITYQLKGEDTCKYCGTILTHAIRTIDHVYARDLGGPTVPNNLEPCCKSCNTRKRIFDKEEFERYLQIEKSEELKKEFLVEFYKKIDIERKATGVVIPEKWYVLRKDYDVWAQITSVERYRTNKQYIQISELYSKYNKICRTVVITKNNMVVEGFLALMFAKNLSYKVKIPFVILENVIAY